MDVGLQRDLQFHHFGGNCVHFTLHLRSRKIRKRTFGHVRPAKTQIPLGANRKQGNDQESIQVSNPFHPRHQQKKREALKATTPQSKHYKQKAKRTVSFPKIGQTAIQNNNKKIKIHQDIMQRRHTMIKIVNNSRSTTLERPVNILRGGARGRGRGEAKSILRGQNPRF